MDSLQTETSKRPADEELQEQFKRQKTENGLDALASVSYANADEENPDDTDPVQRGPMTKARENRLEQNRKAARESRRRKKLMIEGKSCFGVICMIFSPTPYYPSHS